MKEYEVTLEGTWCYMNLIEAASKEEAIEIAMEDIDREIGCLLSLNHINQWVDNELGENFRGMFTIQRKPGAIIFCQASHTFGPQWFGDEVGMKNREMYTMEREPDAIIFRQTSHNSENTMDRWLI